jgi:hypothetical protein
VLGSELVDEKEWKESSFNWILSVNALGIKPTNLDPSILFFESFIHTSNKT